MLSFARRFWRDETGATAIEYGLIGALVAVVIVTGVTAVGSRMGNKYNMVSGKLT